MSPSINVLRSVTSVLHEPSLPGRFLERNNPGRIVSTAESKNSLHADSQPLIKKKEAILFYCSTLTLEPTQTPNPIGRR
jgi:hypothetical protein